MLMVGAIMGYAGTQEMDRLDGGVDLMDFVILSFIMPIVAMIYGASLIRNEIDDKSITQVVTAPLDRAVSYLGYFLSLVISLSVIMILICLVGWLAFFAQKGMGGAAGILASMCALAVIGTVAYSSLFMMTGVLFKRPIYFGLFFAFIWEGFVGSVPGAIGKYTIKHLIRSMGSGWVDHGSLGSYADASSGAGFILAFLVCLFLVLGIVLFREMEFP
jgi:ABC-2 type transport system permease protein